MSTEEAAPTDPGWDDLTPEQKQRLLKLASGGVTRRDVLAGGSALLAGGAIGGGASTALTEPAAASHGAGTVGEAGNPIDTAYVTSINGDGDQVNVSPALGSSELRGTRTTDISVNIPTDYSTLQAAFDDLREQVIPNNVEVELFIETGHAIQTGTKSDSVGPTAALYAANGDFSNFVIRSADATVPVETGFTGSVIRNVNCRGVQLDCQIDMANADSTNGEDGYTVEFGGHGRVHDGGVKNAVGDGLLLRGPVFFDRYGTTMDFSGAGDAGCYAAHGAQGYIRGINFSGATNDGIKVAESWVDAQSADVSGSAGNGVNLEAGGVAFCQSVNANNCSSVGLRVDGGTIFAQDATADGCSTGVNALYSAVVKFGGAASADSCSIAIQALGPAHVHAGGTTLTNASGARAVLASRGATVNVLGADLTGGAATTKVQARNGGQVVAVNANVGTTSNDNLEVSDGGVINANGATYNTTNVTLNSLSASGYITG